MTWHEVLLAILAAVAWLVAAHFAGLAQLAHVRAKDSEGLLAEERLRTKDLQNRLDARSLTEYAVADEYVSHEHPAEDRSPAGIPKNARFVSDETGLVDGYVLDDDDDANP